jgi:hypothetical protein
VEKGLIDIGLERLKTVVLKAMDAAKATNNKAIERSRIGRAFGTPPRNALLNGYVDAQRKAARQSAACIGDDHRIRGDEGSVSLSISGFSTSHARRIGASLQTRR